MCRALFSRERDDSEEPPPEENHGPDLLELPMFTFPLAKEPQAAIKARRGRRLRWARRGWPLPATTSLPEPAAGTKVSLSRPPLLMEGLAPTFEDTLKARSYHGRKEWEKKTRVPTVSSPCHKAPRKRVSWQGALSEEI